MLEYQKAMAVVDAYIKHLSNGDVSAVVDLYAEGATVEDPVGTEPMTSEATISEFYQKAADMKVTLTSTGPGRLAGNEIAFPFQVAANMEGNNMVIDIIDVFTLNDDYKVTSMRAFWGGDNMRG